MRGQPRQNGAALLPPAGEEGIAGNARRERRALHFIAAASSLFIADTTLRHISSVFPPGIARYVRQRGRKGKERQRKTEREREGGGSDGS